MEPWDGPAALAATDGRWVIAGMDRNGLRPMRYSVTDDGLLIVGSETGMVRARRKRDRAKGPRRPRPDDRASIWTPADSTTNARSRTCSPREHPYGERLDQEDRRPDSPIIGPTRRAVDVHGRTCAAARSPSGMTLRGSGTDPPSDGGRRQGSGRLDGRRHAAGGAVGPISRAVSITSGRISARSPIRRSTRLREDAGDEPEDPLRQSRQRAGRRTKARCEVLACWKARCCPPACSRRMRRTMGEAAATRSTAHSRRRRRARKALREAIERIRREAEDAVREGCTHADPDRRACRARIASPIPMILAAGGGPHAIWCGSGLRTYTSHQCAFGRMPGHALFRRADRRRRDHRQRLSGRRNASPTAMRRGLFGELTLGGCVERYLEGDATRPAQDHVQDGHLGDLVLSRRL